MLKRVGLFLLIAVSLQATTIRELLNGVKGYYGAQSDEISIAQTKNGLSLVNAQFWPKINFVASYTHYNYPTALKPVTPTDSSAILKKKGALPFSKNIARLQINLSMPIFVKSLYTLADKAKIMQESARAKKRVDILKNQAAVIGANANWIYLQALKSSLIRKKKTLLQTLQITQIAVNSGAKPKIAEYKVKEGINKIYIAINNIKIQEQNLKAIIKTLTGIKINKPVKMRKIGSYRVGSIVPVEPLRAKNRAEYLEMKAQKEKLYPSLHLRANYTKSYGKDYIQDRSIHTNYSSVGVMLNMPILDMAQYKNIQKAKLAYLKGEIEVKKLADKLKNEALSMQEQLRLLRESKKYAKENIVNEKRLFKVAKVSYKAGRMPIEEYLRYIDALYEAKADYYKVEAKYWQTLAQIAFVYGNDFMSIVR